MANQNENNQWLCDEKDRLPLSLKESQWKQKQQHDQHFPVKERPKIEINQKEQHCKN